MDALLRLLLTNAAVAGLLAVAAWTASRLVRRPAVVHALWLLALVKLVTPPLVSLPLLPARDAIAPAPARKVPARADSLPAAPATPARPATAVSSIVAAVDPTGSGPVPGKPLRSLPAPLTLVLSTLVAGSAAIAGLTAWRFARFGRVVARAEPAPPELAARAAELAACLGIRHAPRLLVVPARVPPALWPTSSGPRLLLPRDLLPSLLDDERDALLAHELAHVRRGDHRVRFLEIAATTLFWWYPVTWWARRALRRAEERCCDEWVLRALPSSARAYANGILKSLAFIADVPGALPVAASGAGPIRDIESRLKEILMTHPLPQLSRPARLALAAAAVAGLVVFPTHARPRPAAGSLALALQDAAEVLPVPGADGPATAPPPGTPSAFVATRRPLPAAAVLAPGTTPAPTLLRETLVVVDEEGDPALEAERRALEEQRAHLQLQQLDLERRSVDLEARAEQKGLAAEAARLKAEGEAERAARAESRRGLVEQRLGLQKRQIELQVREIQLEAERQKAEREAETSARAADRKGNAQAAERLRQDADRAEQELAEKRKALDAEVQQLERQTRALEAETRVHELKGASEELARSLADQIESLREALPESDSHKAELQREIERLQAAVDALKAGRAERKAPHPTETKPRG